MSFKKIFSNSYRVCTFKKRGVQIVCSNLGTLNTQACSSAINLQVNSQTRWAKEMNAVWKGRSNGQKECSNLAGEWWVNAYAPAESPYEYTLFLMGMFESAHASVLQERQWFKVKRWEKITNEDREKTKYKCPHTLTLVRVCVAGKQPCKDTYWNMNEKGCGRNHFMRMCVCFCGCMCACTCGYLR